jgi:hypothetical protein
MSLHFTSGGSDVRLLSGGRILSAVALGAALCLAQTSMAGSVRTFSTAGPVTTFSAGPYVLPETISQAPSTFGSFGGDYIIPDFNAENPNGNVWAVPSGGGSPVSIATNGNVAVRGGVFLPSNWGANAGSFLEVGLATSGVTAPVLIVSPNGTVQQFSSLSVNAGQPVIAPSSFGSFGGQVVIPNSPTTGGGSVVLLAPNGSSSTLAAGANVPAGGGAAFAPSGFGSRGGSLFVDGLSGNQIVSISANGTVTPFATVPLKAGQPSPFQMQFSPAGFLPGQGPLLFVSIRGSTLGGGTLGDVLAYNSSGELVASLRSDLGLTSFDPRGLLFIPDPTNPGQSDLLVSNAEPEILLISGAAFAAVPEPSGLTLGLLAGVGLALRRWRKRL